MKTYIVISITEQDFGCEEIPLGLEDYVDVALKDNETNEIIKIKVLDDELYKKGINTGSLVTYDGKNIILK